jgi:hypothetical protein
MIDPKENLKYINATTIIQGLLSGDENNSVIQGIKEFNSAGKNAAEIKAWVEEKGDKKLLDRLKKVQELMPGMIPLKTEMPALDYDNAARVESALDEIENKYGIDFSELHLQAKKGLEITEKDIKPNFKDPRFPMGIAGGLLRYRRAKGEDYFITGLKDKKQNGDKTIVSPGQSLSVGQILPTQSDILFGKSLWFAINLVDTGKLDALKVYATPNGEILDGHHRWSAQYIAAGPDKCLTDFTFIDAPINIIVDLMTVFAHRMLRPIWENEI